MEDQSKAIMKDMEETRTSMTEKLEALETHVLEKVQPVTDAVERVSEAAANIVENVKETVHDVTEKVEATVHGVAEKVEATTKAISSAFNLRKQTERHPWAVFGIAATTGCMIGSFLGRRKQRREKAAQSADWSRSKHGKGGNGSSHQTESTKRPKGNKGIQHESWFMDSLRHMKGVALGSMMSYIRDLSKLAIPGAIGNKIAQEVESLTKRMGGEPIQGSVLEPESEHPSEEQKQGQAVETAQSTGDRSRTLPEAVKRFNSGSSGQPR
jgi:ElaB/YqjD/DUF883 family membrane-anchored ribosome-binding protein